MEIITIESEAFKQILNKLDSISKKLNDKEGKTHDKLSAKWLTINQACEILNVSRRTCQAYRDDGVLSFSQYQGKIYFKASDLESHLQKHYKPAFKNNR